MDSRVEGQPNHIICSLTALPRVQLLLLSRRRSFRQGRLKTNDVISPSTLKSNAKPFLPEFRNPASPHITKLSHFFL